MEQEAAQVAESVPGSAKLMPHLTQLQTALLHSLKAFTPERLCTL